eukprot:TRINITY_DN55113_c0_g1_i1.p1 TRINITY_DN55113_c0_g1~~TRINITY_DN55113_c0_g1_i1.p1  ORF type:complete len:469 (+),score=61.87 TRINITY_DN55113_c0_g1_i1:181-1587(+)
MSSRSDASQFDPSSSPASSSSLSDYMPSDVLQRNFRWFAIWFALNHATVTTPLVVATSLLDKRIANIGNGFLYVATCLTTLFIAAPLVSQLGPKKALIVGMVLNCVYCVSFTINAVFEEHCTSCPSARTDPAVSLCASFWLFGSVAGGIGFGVVWTAQGSFFAGSATSLARDAGMTREMSTASLAGKFSFIFLTFEVVAKAIFSVLQSVLLSVITVGTIFSAFAIFATVMTTTILPVGGMATLERDRVGFLDKFTATVSLWGDPVIWLLSPTNFTFGFCAAFMNGYVNAAFVKDELGKESVAMLSAFTVLVAAVVSRVLSYIGSKGAVLQIGGLCFMCIPLSMLLFIPCFGDVVCDSGWGWGIAALFALQGAGRAVYESTNRAVFADFFAGLQHDGAFANCTLQSSLAFALCFFLQAALSKGRNLAMAVVALAATMLLSYPAARLARRHWSPPQRDEALLSGARSSGS